MGRHSGLRSGLPILRTPEMCFGPVGIPFHGSIFSHPWRIAWTRKVETVSRTYGNGGTRTDVLRLLSSRDNLALLSALAEGPSYPRVLAKRLGRSENHIAHRLRALERATFVEGAWSREDGRNVRLYRLKLRRLELLIGEQGWRIGVSESEPSRIEHSAVPARAALYGREAELEELADPRTRFAMVVGLPGIGKTSLAAELAHRYGTGRVLWHAIVPSDTASRFLAAAAERILDGSPAKKTLEPARLLRDVTRRLDERKAIVVLDNYHDTRDKGIDEIVRFWQETRKSGKVVVLSRSRPPFDQTPKTRVMVLAGLSQEASGALLRGRGIRTSANERRLLWRAYRGHPLALKLTDRRPGRRDGDASIVLEQLGRHAAQALDERSRGVLLSMAAVRRPIDASHIRLLSGAHDPSLSLVLLERRGLIRSSGSVYEAHDVLREALAPILATQRDLHRRASAMFRPSARPEDALEAIYHALKAGDVRDTMDLLEAEVLHDRHRLVDRVSVAAYLDVLDAIPLERLPSRHRALVHLQRGVLLYQLAKTSASIREYERARRIAESLGEPLLLAAVLGPLGDLLAYSGRMAEAERHLRRNLRIVEAEGSRDRRARALFLLNRFYDRKGELDRSREYGELALREARRLGDRDLAVDIESSPTAWAFYRPDAERRIRSEMAWVRRHGHPVLLDYCRAFFGERLCRRARALGRGRTAAARRAMAYLRPVVANCDTLRMVWMTTYVRSWYAEALRLSGEMEKAESEAVQVLATERDLGMNHCLILGHQVMAHVLESRGETFGARTHARDALRVAERIGCGCVGMARLELAFQEAALGRVGSAGTARALWRQALHEIRQRGYPDEFRYGLREGQRRGLGAPVIGSFRQRGKRSQTRAVTGTDLSGPGEGFVRRLGHRDAEMEVPVDAVEAPVLERGNGTVSIRSRGPDSSGVF